MGVWDQIAGLIIGKPEFYDQQGAIFNYEALFMEVLGKRAYPIISQFDCSHTVPMLTVPRHIRVSLKAIQGQTEVQLLEKAVVAAEG